MPVVSENWVNINGETSNILSFEVTSVYFRIETHLRCVVTDDAGTQLISNSVQIIKKEEEL